MEKKEKWEKEDKKNIEKRLKLSNKEKWNTLKTEEREAVIDKYYNLRGIEHLGINNILEDDRNIRLNIATLVLGVALGVFGNLFANIFIKYEPNNLLFDLLVIGCFVCLLYKIITLTDRLSADHLGREKILDHLLTIVKKDWENKSE